MRAPRMFEDVVAWRRTGERDRHMRENVQIIVAEARRTRYSPSEQAKRRREAQNASSAAQYYGDLLKADSRQAISLLGGANITPEVRFETSSKVRLPARDVAWLVRAQVVMIEPEVPTGTPSADIGAQRHVGGLLLRAVGDLAEGMVAWRPHPTFTDLNRTQQTVTPSEALKADVVEALSTLPTKELVPVMPASEGEYIQIRDALAQYVVNHLP